MINVAQQSLFLDAVPWLEATDGHAYFRLPSSSSSSSGLRLQVGSATRGDDRVAGATGCATTTALLSTLLPIPHH